MSSRMLHRPALYMPGVHFIVSRSTSALSHIKPAPAGMSPDGCRADSNDKTDALYLPILRRRCGGMNLHFFAFFSLFLVYFIAHGRIVYNCLLADPISKFPVIDEFNSA